ncbi:MAG: type II toxin-antitoxin system HicA family toxin [bacterium]|nr:type II toxin-antitoxin system HicA family toxin [bacterium]
MGRMKILSGHGVVSIFVGFGFSVVSQKGSHIKLARVLPSGERQVLTLPLHSELDRGTLRALFRQASYYIPEDALIPHFFHD